MLREILKELDDKITNEDLDSMIEEIDSDGSGTVDFDGEFSHLNYVRSIEFNMYWCLICIILISAEFMEVMTGGDD